MKSTAQRPAVPKEVEALRTSLESRLSALEKALADPKQHGSLDSLILDLARIATQEADATTRHAVLAAQKAGQKLAEDARAEVTAALEAEKVESAALRKVIEGAKQALKQAEAGLKEERRAAEAATREAAGVRRELAALQESLEQAQSARAIQQRDLDAALAELQGERGASAESAQARVELERSLESIGGELAALRSQHEGALRDVETARTELESTRGGLDTALRDLDAARNELEGLRRELEDVRRDSAARTQTLSHSQEAQAQAIAAAHDAARSAEGQKEEAIRESAAAKQEIAALREQLAAAEQALRTADAVNRELQAAHEARDAAEVEAARHADRSAEADFLSETVVDLTSDTKDEAREIEVDRRIRALELALRDAETRAELAELELAGRRPPAAPASAETAAPPSPAAAIEGQEFRGPARGARRVTFKADIGVQVDGNPGKLVDLSMTGAQVLAPASINPNRLVTVILSADDSPIPCKAKVMWSRLEPRAGQLWYRAGVMFTNPDQAALEAFLRVHQP